MGSVSDDVCGLGGEEAPDCALPGATGEGGGGRYGLAGEGEEAGAPMLPVGLGPPVGGGLTLVGGLTAGELEALGLGLGTVGL